MVHLMHGLIFFTMFFRETKDFDPILFEYSMLLNSKIEKEHFYRYTQEISKNSTKMKNSIIYIYE